MKKAVVFIVLALAAITFVWWKFGLFKTPETVAVEQTPEIEVVEAPAPETDTSDTTE